MGSLASRAASALLLAVLCVSSCGGPPPPLSYRDPAYRREPQQLVPLSIAPAPVAGPRGEGLDHGLERTFADTPGVQMRTQPSILRARLNVDHDLLWCIDQMLAQKYTPEALAAGPSLQSLLSGKQLENLRQVTGDAVLFLLPVEITTTPAGSRTRAHTFYRVYDLQSGRLLLQSSVSVEVPGQGDTGERKAIVELLLQMQADLTQRLL